jgi:hypothetical protein
MQEWGAQVGPPGKDGDRLTSRRPPSRPHPRRQKRAKDPGVLPDLSRAVTPGSLASSGQFRQPSTEASRLGVHKAQLLAGRVALQ